MSQEHTIRFKKTRVSCGYRVDDALETVALEARRQADLSAQAAHRRLQLTRRLGDDNIEVAVEGPEEDVVAMAAALVTLGHAPFALRVEDEEQYERLFIHGPTRGAYFHTITVGF